MTPAKIALDFDQTYTADPAFWNAFIVLSQDRGHDIRVVTIRDRNHDRTKPLRDLELLLPVIYTGGVAKKWFCSHFTDGFSPDIWIDDKPETILNNSTASPEVLKEWRANRVEA